MESLNRVLVLNAGSSSLKWSVLEAATGKILAHQEAPLRHGSRGVQLSEVLAGAGSIDAVGHRVTHGGVRFTGAVRLSAAVQTELESLVALDRLHLEPELAAIDALEAARPELPQVISFDTGFHATMPEAAAQYAVPREWAEKFSVRRFGFHGLSVEWSVLRARVVLGPQVRVIVCHLGSGCSVTAVEAGRSVDTTMGFSPLEGLVMATRSGSIDAGAVLHLLVEEKLAPEVLRQKLAEDCGWAGVSEVSTDLREVLAAAERGEARPVLAVGLFVQSLRRAIGAMAGVLGGVDAVVFTGGIGERSARIRAEAAHAVPGLELDAAANQAVAEQDVEIGTSGSAVRALVVHAREDLIVLRDVRRVLEGHPSGAP